MRSPTIKQLRYFITLCEEQHFGHAAERCFVSQSAFSNAIQELESTLDTQLVDRTNRSVTITSNGQEVATQARLVISDVESLMEIAQGDSLPLSGELRLGVIPTIAPFVLPAVLPKIRKAFPNLELLLIEDQTERIYERLMNGELDLLLLALPREPSESTRKTTGLIDSTRTAFCCSKTDTVSETMRWRLVRSVTPRKFADSAPAAC